MEFSSDYPLTRGHSTRLGWLIFVKVIVDWQLCESNALCMVEAPEVFQIRDDDTLDVLDDQPAEALREKVEAAAHACPKRAISIED